MCLFSIIKKRVSFLKLKLLIFLWWKTFFRCLVVTFDANLCRNMYVTVKHYSL